MTHQNNSNEHRHSLSYYVESMESEFDAILKNFEYLTNKALTFNVKPSVDNQNSHASPTISECTSEESVDDSKFNFQLDDDNDLVTPSNNNDEFNLDTPVQVENTSSMAVIEKNDLTESKPVDNKRKADHNSTTTPMAKKSRSSVQSSISTTETVSKLKIPLPSLDFIGQATDKKMKNIRHDTSVVRDADAVSKFLKSFEEYIKDTNTNWYRSLKSCFETRPFKLYPWFQKNIYQDQSWPDAKSIILKTFGYQSPRVDYALVVCIGKTQNAVPNQSFKEYFETFGRAARGYQYIDIYAYKEGPDNFTNESLISKFIAGASYPMVSTHMYTLLHRLYLSKKDNHTLPEGDYLINGKKFTDVPASWMEFESIIEQEMDYLLLCEDIAKQDQEKEEARQKEEEQRQKEEEKRQKEEEQRQEELEEKRTRREERRKRGTFDRQQIKKETQIAISRMHTDVIAARKKMGVCCFCGIKKHSFSHTLVCPEKQRLIQQG